MIRILYSATAEATVICPENIFLLTHKLHITELIRAENTLQKSVSILPRHGCAHSSDWLMETKNMVALAITP